MFKIRKDEKALRYLNEQLGPKVSPTMTMDKLIDRYYEMIPPSSRMKYGKSKACQTANYYAQYVKKEVLQDESKYERGGGLYCIDPKNKFKTKSSMVAFSTMPVLNGLVLVGVGGGIANMSLDTFLTLLERGVIIDMTEDKAKFKNENFVKDRNFKENLDITFTSKKVLKKFAKFGIPQEEATQYINILEESVPEEILAQYDATQAGRLAAISQYMEEDEEEVIAIVDGLRQLTNEKDDMKLETGQVVLSTKTVAGLPEHYTMLIYKEDDNVALLPIARLKSNPVAKKVFMTAAVVGGVCLVCFYPPATAAALSGVEGAKGLLGVTQVAEAKAGVASANAAHASAMAARKAALAQCLALEGTADLASMTAAKATFTTAMDTSLAAGRAVTTANGALHIAQASLKINCALGAYVATMAVLSSGHDEKIAELHENAFSIMGQPETYSIDGSDFECGIIQRPLVHKSYSVMMTKALVRNSNMKETKSYAPIIMSEAELLKKVAKGEILYGNKLLKKGFHVSKAKKQVKGRGAV